MKPNFALSLSFEGIALLRRAPGGWFSLGDTPLDTADLNTALKALRDKADAVAPDGGKVKLVIPNEQIRYLEIEDNSGRGDAMTARIEAALDGATPYPVADLVYDWSDAGGKIQVAAVARETLAEAEMFASGHHFDPVCFVARAPDGTFDGEVFFGAAQGWSGPKPERDDAAIRLIAAPPIDEPVSATVKAPEQKARTGADTPSPSAPTAAKPTPPTPPAAAAPTVTPAPELAPQAAPEPPAEPEPPAPLPFTSIRASRGAEGAAPKLGAPSPRAPAASQPPKAAPQLSAAADSAETIAPPANPFPTPEPAPAPSLKERALAFKAKVEQHEAHQSPPQVAGVTSDTIQDPPAEEGASARLAKTAMNFFSRRKAAKAEPAAPAPLPDTGPAITTRVASPTEPDAPPKRVLTSALMAKRKSQAAPAAAANATDPALEERRRMTVFGAREEVAVGGKPRFLGLMLTAALLVFLLGMAAWASVFLDDGLARFFPDQRNIPAIAETDDDTEEPAPVELAALETAPTGTVSDALSTPLPDIADSMTPEEAEATYAATGIWQRTPIQPNLPPNILLEDVYAPSIDGAVEQLDAVALEPPSTLATDMAFASLPNPVPPSITFALDSRGLVIATPEGAMNPEGVLIYAGKPPVQPPLRPQEAALLNEDPNILAERARLAAARPKMRPGGLLEGNERATLQGFSRAELAGIRPQARAITQKEEDEKDTAATAQAIRQSPKPITRPRNFARIVEQARDRAQEAPAQATQVAAVAPRTVSPSIPSSASVAKNATVRNAINLRKVNLIGVYGKPSSRRALVRLSNGRYKKVKVGDRIDGGQVQAIAEAELRYVKNGRNVVLELPR